VLASARDAGLIAWFHLRRALRTRSAIVLAMLNMLVAGGGAWVSTRVIHELEKAAAATLKVPATRRPGAMIETLKEQEQLQEVLRPLVGSEELLQWALELPVLTPIHFWLALGTLPFLAVALGAETIAPDVRDRSLRYELVRTGRMELLLGRFAGQALLLGLAAVMAAMGTWIVAATVMVQQPLVAQAGVLLALTPRLWLWSLPFLGVGMAASQLTGNVNVARALGLGATTASWLGFGTLESPWGQEHPVVADVFVPLLPQGWMMDLWGPGTGWLLSGVVLAALGVATTMVAWPVFGRRNL
jgi:hypothetical protein